MRPSPTALRLTVLLCILVALASACGLFWPQEGQSRVFATLHGEEVTLYGRGLYRNDTLFTAAGNRGVDLTLLVLVAPLMAISATLYSRGSVRGGLLLVGALAFSLYAYVSTTFASAYNPLFLLYTAIFSASLFGLIATLRSLGPEAVRGHLGEQLPQRSLAVFLYICAAATLFIWLEPIITGLVRGEAPPLLDSYTTLVTYALDLAVITPTVLLAATMVLKRQPFGYVLSMALLVLLALLAPQIVAQSVFQVRAGVNYAPGEIAGPICGFATLAVAALYFLVRILRGIEA